VCSYQNIANFACVHQIPDKLLKLIKNIAAICVLLVFVLSTSGITILTHYCSGSHKTTQHVFYEFADKESGCGGMSCSVSHKGATSSLIVSIGKASCCEENSVFYKIAAVDNPTANQVCVKIPVNNLFIPDLQFLSFSPIEIKALNFLQGHCISPPLSGKQLVVFLNQLRIPLPSC
jgi:hypothetical protein